MLLRDAAAVGPPGPDLGEGAGVADDVAEQVAVQPHGELVAVRHGVESQQVGHALSFGTSGRDLSHPIQISASHASTRRARRGAPRWANAACASA